MGQPAAVETGLTPAWHSSHDHPKIDTYSRFHWGSIISGSGFVGLRAICCGCCYCHPDGRPVGFDALLRLPFCGRSGAEGKASLARFPWRRCQPAPAQPRCHALVSRWSVQRVVGSRQSCFACAIQSQQRSKPGATVAAHQSKSRLQPTLRQTRPAGTTAWNCSPAARLAPVPLSVRANLEDAVHAPASKSATLVRLDAMQRRMSPASGKKWRWRWETDRSPSNRAERGLRQACRWRGRFL